MESQELVETPATLDTGAPLEPMEPLNPFVGRVVDLVDPYLTVDISNGGGKLTPPPRLLCHWLDTHPGRWALTAERGMGTSSSIMSRLGYQVAMRDSQRYHYARVPHPEGEPLSEALHRSKNLLDVLPAVQPDPFGWTAAELADAVECAMANLFPVAEESR